MSFLDSILDRFGERKAAKEAAEQLSHDQTVAWNAYWSTLVAITTRPEMAAFGLAAATGEQPASILGDLENAGVLRHEMEQARAKASKLVAAEQLFNLERHALDLLVNRVVDNDGMVDQREYGQVFACSALLGSDRMSPASIARFLFGRVNAGYLPDPVEPVALLLKRGESCYFDHEAQLVAQPKGAVGQTGQPQPVPIPLGRQAGWTWQGSAGVDSGGAHSDAADSSEADNEQASGLEILDRGRVSLTDRRMVFTGTRKSIDMRLNKLNAAWVAGPVLTLHRSDRVKPTLIALPDASEDLAAALLVLLTQSAQPK